MFALRCLLCLKMFLRNCDTWVPMPPVFWEDSGSDTAAALGTRDSAFYNCSKVRTSLQAVMGLQFVAAWSSIPCLRSLFLNHVWQCLKQFQLARICFCGAGWGTAQGLWNGLCCTWVIDLTAPVLRRVVRQNMGWNANLGRWVKWQKRGSGEEKCMKFFTENLGKSMGP